MNGKQIVGSCKNSLRDEEAAINFGLMEIELRENTNIFTPQFSLRREQLFLETSDKVSEGFILSSWSLIALQGNLVQDAARII